ncbi:fasciclin domain-containing protein [Chitinophaga eiseniae]|uniref:FAS1 domain-containing protein n=1 Tax=Chitinophaga eiseniae TaxID=634771 RepID=A0A847SKK3_9BACT|nr:fasciclin domain-containing protein [Chitinophaga eiseniae]NLR82431.1 hypothetical protein [Chitinophaga eiseniae]
MKRYFPFYIFLLTLLAAACKKLDITSDDHTADVRMVGDFIHNNYDLSLLSAALQKTGFLDSLNADGPFTVWAPDNQAFKALGINKPEDFNGMNTDSLRTSLKNLVIKDRLYIAAIPTQLDNRYATLGNMTSYVSVGVIGNNADAYPAVFNGGMVYDAPKRNLAMKNGVVHVIQAVPKYVPQQITDYLSADTSLSVFVTLLKKTKQWETLKTDGPFTVYAPSNSAFLGYNLTADSINKLDVSRYNPLAFNIYTLCLQPHHILMKDFDVIGAYSEKLDIGSGYFINPHGNFTIWAPGGRWGAHSPGGITVDGGAKGQDIMVSNGVINRMNNILLYPDSLLIK